MFWSLPNNLGATKLLGISLQCLLRCSGLWLTLFMWKRPRFSQRLEMSLVLCFCLWPIDWGVLLIVSVVRPIALNLSDGSLTIFVCFRRPLSLKQRLGFPDLGVLTPSVARAFILERAKSSAFALFVMKRKEKIFGYFFQGRTFLIASFGLRCG